MKVVAVGTTIVFLDLVVGEGWREVAKIDVTATAGAPALAQAEAAKLDAEFNGDPLDKAHDLLTRKGFTVFNPQTNTWEILKWYGVNHDEIRREREEGRW